MTRNLGPRVATTIRMPKDLYARIEAAHGRTRVPLNTLMVEALEAAFPKGSGGAKKKR